jgi:predicted Fe-Mo cluster-binding NifX family protein
MKVAFSTDGVYVSAHFGRCPSFTLVDIEGNTLMKKEIVQNPGHQPGFIPEFLREHGVSCVVAGGMGRRAEELFAQAGIRTILGVSCTVDDAIQQILEGRLQGGESLCAPGAGKGYGVEKSECTHGEHHEAHGHAEG